MSDPGRPLVLVRTRPLGQGNYGGILQAYALQRALDVLGFDSLVDLSLGSVASRSRARARAKTTLRRFLTRVGAPGVVRSGWIADAIRDHQDEPVQRFVRERIHTVELYDNAGRVDVACLERFNLFLTGSDQVWRAVFGRVPTYLFDFVPTSDARPRVAYAASFGTSELEYTPELIELTRQLAQRLDLVSVREDSAVGLARRLWDVEAVHVLDPTLLLDPRDYSLLIDAAGPPVADGGLASYVLDDRVDTRRTVHDLASRLGVACNGLLPPTPPSYRHYRRDPRKYARPSVEDWLGQIRDAEFVVTDSFHGTVFAIVFNRPFISVVNRQRGATRFESLLRLLGLEDRLVQPGSSVQGDLIDHPIRWDRVNARLANERANSWNFLRAATRLIPADTRR